MANPTLKILLISETASAGVYIALTRGILFVYLVTIGAGVDGIALVVGIVAAVSTIVHLFLYKKPGFLITKVRMKFTIMHGMERVLWIFVPFTSDPLLIALIFSIINALPTGSFMNLVIFGSLSEDEIKDVTAKRFASFNVSLLIGFGLATMLVAFLPADVKFFYIYVLGSLVGLISTVSVALMKMSHLEGMKVPTGIEQPEKVFSTFAFFVALLASGNLLAMIWTPFVMNGLNAPDYLVVAMSLAGTFSSIVGAFIWKGRSFKSLRYSLAADTVAPAVAPVVPLPFLHLFLSGLSAVTYTGGNFVGNFLFARYNRWLGAIRSSILLTIALSLAQTLVAPIGIFGAESFLLLFLFVVLIKIVSTVLATVTIPEVAFVPEESARRYSATMYANSMTGYQVSVESSKEALQLTMKLGGLVLMAIILYFIYRVLFIVAAP